MEDGDNAYKIYVDEQYNIKVILNDYSIKDIIEIIGIEKIELELRKIKLNKIIKNV